MAATTIARRALLRSVPLISAVALVCLATLVMVGSGSDTWTDIATRTLINVVLVVGIGIFIGQSGVMSFGHIGFMAIGAYVTGLLTIPPVRKPFVIAGVPDFLAGTEWSFLAAALMGALVAMVVAALFGAVILKLNGFAAAISTLAMLIVIQVVVTNWESLTGGLASMAGVPAETDIGRALPAAIAAIAVAFAFQASRTGRRLRASRDDEFVARALGVNVVRERLVAFVLSAGVVAFGGGLFAQFVGVFGPDDFFLTLTFLTLAMLVVGGIGSLTGAVIGALLVSVVYEGLVQVGGGVEVLGASIKIPAGLPEVLLAVCLLFVLALRPSGLTGGRELFDRATRLRLAVRPPPDDGPISDGPTPIDDESVLARQRSA